MAMEREREIFQITENHMFYRWLRMVNGGYHWIIRWLIISFPKNHS
jgi:hypothetical protein